MSREIRSLYPSSGERPSVYEEVKQNRTAAFGNLPAEGSTFWRLSLGLVVRLDLTFSQCCVAQCTTLLWCWSLTSVQVRLSPLQGSRVLCRRSSLRWPNGRVLKVQCSQSLVYSGVLALFEVLGTTPNSPPRRDNAVTSEKYSRVGYVPSPPGSPPWRQLSFRTEPCWEKPLTWCPCSSRKIKISYPIVRNAVGEADLNVVSWT